MCDLPFGNEWHLINIHLNTERAHNQSCHNKISSNTIVAKEGMALTILLVLLLFSVVNYFDRHRAALKILDHLALREVLKEETEEHSILGELKKGKDRLTKRRSIRLSPALLWQRPLKKRQTNVGSIRSRHIATAVFVGFSEIPERIFSCTTIQSLNYLFFGPFLY